MTRIGDPAGARPGLGPVGAFPGDFATVQAGETTLAQVAQRLGIPLDVLRACNPQISDPNRLATGQEIFTSRPFSTLAEYEQEMATLPTQRGVQGRSAEQQLESMMRKQQVQSGIQEAGAQQGGSGIDLQAWATKFDPVQTSTVQFDEKGMPIYDPKVGPQVTNDMWTNEMLTADLTQELLMNMKDPAAFLNARKQLLQRPTDARSIAPDGTSTPINPQNMSTMDAAVAMRERLMALGMRPIEISEEPTTWFRIDYGTDDRRHYHLGALNIGKLQEIYATHTKDMADQMVREELRNQGLL